MKNTETFAQYLHRKRLEASLKRGHWMSLKDYQAYVAEALTAQGIPVPTENTLFRWENGHHTPSIKKVKAIAAILGK